MKRSLRSVMGVVFGALVGASAAHALTMISVRVPGKPELGWLADGETKVGVINQPLEVDAARFAASSGDVVNIRVTPISTPLAPRLELQDPTGAIVGEACGGDGHATGILEPRLAKTGTYTLRVSEYYGSRTGTYAVSLAWMSARRGAPARVPDAGLITNGAVRAATLTHWADMDTARFCVVSGQAARITMGRSEATNVLMSHVALYDPDGSQVAYACADDTAVLSNRLTSTGIYTIRCMDYYGSHRGNYRVGLTVYPVQ